MIVEEKATTTAPPETGELILRRATPQDCDALLAMYLSFEPKGACLGLPPRKDPQRWLDSLSAFANFVILSGARIVAHGALCNNAESGEVAVFVHQDFRGRRLGKRLLAELVEEARRKSLKRIWGMTELDNVPMLRLARSLGFLPADDPREFFLLL